MLKLMRKITGNKLDLFYKGIVFTALENGAAAGALAFFCLFFIALYEGSLQAPLLWCIPVFRSQGCIFHCQPQQDDDRRL